MIPNDYFQLKKELLGCFNSQIICCPECGSGKEDESTINTEWYRCSKCGWKDSWGKTISREEWINKDRLEKLGKILTD